MSDPGEPVTGDRDALREHGRLCPECDSTAMLYGHTHGVWFCFECGSGGALEERPDGTLVTGRRVLRNFGRGGAAPNQRDAHR